MNSKLRSKVELAILILGVLFGTPLAIYMGYDAGVSEAKAAVASK